MFRREQPSRRRHRRVGGMKRGEGHPHQWRDGERAEQEQEGVLEDGAGRSHFISLRDECQLSVVRCQWLGHWSGGQLRFVVRPSGRIARQQTQIRAKAHTTNSNVR